MQKLEKPMENCLLKTGPVARPQGNPDWQEDEDASQPGI